VPPATMTLPPTLAATARARSSWGVPSWRRQATSPDTTATTAVASPAGPPAGEARTVQAPSTAGAV
jgi:hypothetical protein